MLLEVFRADRRHIHQRNRLVLADIQLFARREILAERLLDRAAQLALFNLDVVEAGQERSVAAVVAPVCIDHAQLGDRRVAVLLVAEIVAAEREVLQRHRKAHRAVIRLQLLLAPRDHAGHALDVRRVLDLHVEALGLLHRSQAGFDRVHDVVLDPVHFLLGKVAPDGDDLCVRHLRALALRQELHALRSGIGALVVLAGQVFRCEDLVVPADGVVLVVNVVDIRLGEDRAGRSLELLAGKPGNVVAVQNAQVLNRLEAEVVAQIRHHVTGLDVEPLSFLHKYACDHSKFLSLLKFRGPCTACGPVAVNVTPRPRNRPSTAWPIPQKSGVCDKIICLYFITGAV